MRAVILVAVMIVAVMLGLASCSYGFGDLTPSFARVDAGPGVDGGPIPGVDAYVPPTGPRDVLDPAWPCNPVSHLGCSEGSTYCLGDIESNVAITDLRCRGGFGSGSYGTYCADLSFCVAGFLCWTDPDVPGATDGTCGEPCFDSTDCTPGYRCDTGSDYRVGFASTTVYRCVPGSP